MGHYFYHGKRMLGLTSHPSKTSCYAPFFKCIIWKLHTSTYVWLKTSLELRKCLSLEWAFRQPRFSFSTFHQLKYTPRFLPYRCRITHWLLQVGVPLRVFCSYCDRSYCACSTAIYIRPVQPVRGNLDVHVLSYESERGKYWFKCLFIPALHCGGNISINFGRNSTHLLHSKLKWILTLQSLYYECSSAMHH